MVFTPAWKICMKTVKLPQISSNVRSALLVSLFCDLKVEHPIRVVSKHAFSHHRDMARLRPFLTPVNTKNVMDAFITSRLSTSLFFQVSQQICELVLNAENSQYTVYIFLKSLSSFQNLKKKTYLIS